LNLMLVGMETKMIFLKMHILNQLIL